MNCENCNTEHDGSYGSGRFCATKCARSFSTKVRRKEINRTVSLILSGQSGQSPSWNKGLTASNDKRVANGSKRAREVLVKLHQERNAKRLEQWKQGLIKVSAAQAKALLILERGARCKNCGWSETNPYSNTVPVELEHVDGDCYNNAYENVCVICPNCHALTSTYRGLNRGKGKGRKFYAKVMEMAKQMGVSGYWGQ